MDRNQSLEKIIQVLLRHMYTEKSLIDLESSFKALNFEHDKYLRLGHDAYFESWVPDYDQKPLGTILFHLTDSDKSL
jgi:hypothetical protein